VAALIVIAQGPEQRIERMDLAMDVADDVQRPLEERGDEPVRGIVLCHGLPPYLHPITNERCKSLI